MRRYRHILGDQDSSSDSESSDSDTSHAASQDTRGAGREQERDKAYRASPVTASSRPKSRTAVTAGVESGKHMYPHTLTKASVSEGRNGSAGDTNAANVDHSKAASTAAAANKQTMNAIITVDDSSANSTSSHRHRALPDVSLAIAEAKRPLSNNKAGISRRLSLDKRSVSAGEDLFSHGEVSNSLNVPGSRPVPSDGTRHHSPTLDSQDRPPSSDAAGFNAFRSDDVTLALSSGSGSVLSSETHSGMKRTHSFSSRKAWTRALVKNQFAALATDVRSKQVSLNHVLKGLRFCCCCWC
jgi:hypothetical protein